MSYLRHDVRYVSVNPVDDQQPFARQRKRRSRMLEDNADRHELAGKGETEAEAQERFAYVKKQKRLAKNRDTARRSRYLACVCASLQHTRGTGFEPAPVFLLSELCLHACRQAKKERLRSLQNRIELLELGQIRLKQAVLQRDEQLLQMRSLPATPCRGLPLHFTTIDMFLSTSSQPIGCMSSKALPKQSVIVLCSAFS